MCLVVWWSGAGTKLALEGDSLQAGRLPGAGRCPEERKPRAGGHMTATQAGCWSSVCSRQRGWDHGSQECSLAPAASDSRMCGEANRLPQVGAPAGPDSEALAGQEAQTGSFDRGRQDQVWNLCKVMPAARWRRHFQGVLWLEPRKSRGGGCRQLGQRHWVAWAKVAAVGGGQWVGSRDGNTWVQGELANFSGQCNFRSARAHWT